MHACVQETLGTIPSRNFHMRLAWSPDGQMLVATNCIKGPANVAPLIQRNSWASDSQLVGHKGPVTAVRYNPRFFYPRHGKSDEVCCIATLCANDKKWSVWSPVEASPIVVGKVRHAPLRSAPIQVDTYRWNKKDLAALARKLDGLWHIAREPALLTSTGKAHAPLCCCVPG